VSKGKSPQILFYIIWGAGVGDGGWAKECGGGESGRGINKNEIIM